jgi:hypothetical protein
MQREAALHSPMYPHKQAHLSRFDQCIHVPARPMCPTALALRCSLLLCLRQGFASGHAAKPRILSREAVEGVHLRGGSLLGTSKWVMADDELGWLGWVGTVYQGTLWWLIHGALAGGYGLRARQSQTVCGAASQPASRGAGSRRLDCRPWREGLGPGSMHGAACRHETLARTPCVRRRQQWKGALARLMRALVGADQRLSAVVGGT